MKILDALFALMAFVGLVVLFGIAGELDTSEVVSLWRVAVGVGMMMPLFIKYFWKEFVR